MNGSGMPVSGNTPEIDAMCVIDWRAIIEANPTRRNFPNFSFVL
jgi:hypothetical protein